MTDIIEQMDGAVRLRVHAQPRSSRTELVGAHGDALKIRIAAPPVDGAANEELVRFLAKRLGIAQSRIRVVSGDAGRSKLIEIEAIDAALVRTALLG